MQDMTITPTVLGDLMKKELKERGTTQRLFAEAIGVRPPHLSEMLKGKRAIPVSLLPKIASFIGLPIDELLECQANLHIASKKEKMMSQEEMEASKVLEQYDRVVSVKSLLKSLGESVAEPKRMLEEIRDSYSLSNPDVLAREFQALGNRCFRRSAKSGGDVRMIATWVVKAQRLAKQCVLNVNYVPEHNEKLAVRLAELFHRNENTLTSLRETLNSYGIGFAVLEKEEHASIDGYSFFVDKNPFIVVTNRYKRIDNLAFTVMHELGHIAKGHTACGVSMLNVDERQQEMDMDECVDIKEKEADAYATDHLIPPSLWCLTPKVSMNPFTIQWVFTDWARRNALNEWIVLGRVAHETGMYRFKSNNLRGIN